MDNFNEAKALKPYLRFDIGDVVFLKSDLEKACPMVIVGVIAMDDDVDYAVTWTNSQRTQERAMFPDKALANDA